MSALTRRWLTLYLLLLLALAVLGAGNQRAYFLQSELIAHKEALQLELAELRRQASLVNGTLAVRQWAYAQGMIPATEADSVAVAPFPAPEPDVPERGLEVRTLWR